MKEMFPNPPLEVPRELIIYGGSFNPPTMAHASVVEALTEQYPDIPTWVMPSRARLDKPDLASDEDRFAMLSLMKTDLGFSDQVAVADFEYALPMPSNTAQTVTALRAAGAEKIHFVSGLDSINTVLEWEEGEMLLNSLHWLIINRPGYELEVRPPAHEYFDLHYIKVSSTDVRERVEVGLPIDDLVSPSVAEYIYANNLYQGART